MTVAFEEALNANDRLFLGAFGNRLLEGKERTAGKGKFWCAADKPSGDNGIDFALRRVYRTTKLPKDEYGHPVRCEECGIEIEKLQEMFNEVLP